MTLLQTVAADALLVTRAVEFHQLPVVGTQPLRQVGKRLTQLVCPEEGVLLVRAHVLRAERRDASQTRFHRLGLVAHVAHDGLGLGAWRAALTGSAEAAARLSFRPCSGFGPEGFDHRAEHRVLLELRLGEVVRAAVRAVVGARAVPGLLEAHAAEAVTAIQTHRLVEGTQADAAGQIVLQAQQSHRFGHFCHDGGQEGCLSLWGKRRNETGVRS